MKKSFGFILLILLGGFLFAADQPKFEPLPVPLSNNAVASVKSRGSLLLYSVMGIGPKKTWYATSNSAYMLDSEAETGKWAEVRSVPGSGGGLAATVVGDGADTSEMASWAVDPVGGESYWRRVFGHEPVLDRGIRA